MFCDVNYLYWYLTKYIHAGLQAQFFKKSPLVTFNCKMVAIKQILKKLIDRRTFHAALHDVFSEMDDTFTTLSFTNLACPLLCWLKDCNNVHESENEGTDV